MEEENSKRDNIGLPCPNCNSSDAYGYMASGVGYCFSCMVKTPPISFSGEVGGTTKDINNKKEITIMDEKDLLVGYGPFPKSGRITSRNISADTCEFWDYRYGEHYNPSSQKVEKCHVANFKANGQVVGQKLRFGTQRVQKADGSIKLIKSFVTLGDINTLYGKWLWLKGGQKIIITEGELDALAVSEMNILTGNRRYPVVSLPNGVSAAVSVINHELEWLERNFTQIILMFDNDEQGQEAVAKVAPLFSKGKCLVTKFSEKDACDMLKLTLCPRSLEEGATLRPALPAEGATRKELRFAPPFLRKELQRKGENKVAELKNSIFQAAPYMPTDIIFGDKLFDRLIAGKQKDVTVDYPFAELNKLTGGLREDEITLICAGTGQGKTLFCKELIAKLISVGKRVGYISLEENTEQSIIRLMSVEASKPLHLEEDKSNSGYTKEEQERLNILFSKYKDNLFIYEHRGYSGPDKILSSIRNMVVGKDVNWIVLDHLSYIISGLSEGDERRLIDNLMNQFVSLTNELKFGLILASHFKKPAGDKDHGDGLTPSIAYLKGSSSIAQASDIVIGLGRNQQAECPIERNTTELRVLKNRFSGNMGSAGRVFYNKETGRLEDLIVTGFEGLLSN